MLELCGDLFNPSTYQRVIETNTFVKYRDTPKPDAICITTNGFVKSDGRCVMGKGCALKARDLFPTIDRLLGTHINSKGNIPGVLGNAPNGYAIVSFPVKPKGIKILPGKINLVEHMRDNFSEGDIAPGWAAKAELNLIHQSAVGIKLLADKMNWKMVIVPRPGCGAGELTWNQVKPILTSMLDDRFYTITF